MRVLCFLALCLSLSIFTAPQAAPEACRTKKVSEPVLKELRSLQYRVRRGLNYDAIQSDLDRLRSDANCYEQKVLQAVAIEADAFSRTPERALPALYLLYQQISKEDRRYPMVLRALGKNYGMLARVNDLQGLIDLHPDAPVKIMEYWQTSLAMAHAQNGDPDTAIAVIRAFVANEEQITAETFRVAIAIYELADDSAEIEKIQSMADTVLGELKWPLALDGMGDQKFEILYRRRFDPALSDAAPLTRPIPRYPPRAIERWKEGHCDVHFDVSEDGKPINVSADCTSTLFKKEAERAVSEVVFEPLVYKGKTYIRRDVVYPLSFNLKRRR